jgi:hypothetical protein
VTVLADGAEGVDAPVYDPMPSDPGALRGPNHAPAKRSKA